MSYFVQHHQDLCRLHSKDETISCVLGCSSYSWYLGLAKKTEAAVVMEMNNSFANEFTVRAIHRYLGTSYGASK